MWNTGVHASYRELHIRNSFSCGFAHVSMLMFLKLLSSSGVDRLRRRIEFGAVSVFSVVKRNVVKMIFKWKVTLGWTNVHSSAPATAALVNFSICFCSSPLSSLCPCYCRFGIPDFNAPQNIGSAFTSSLPLLLYVFLLKFLLVVVNVSWLDRYPVYSRNCRIVFLVSHSNATVSFRSVDFPSVAVNVKKNHYIWDFWKNVFSTLSPTIWFLLQIHLRDLVSLCNKPVRFSKMF